MEIQSKLFIIPVIASILILGTLGFTQQAMAVFPTEVPRVFDHVSCDTPVIPSVVDELGTGSAFPLDERITARFVGEHVGNVCTDGNDQAPNISANLILEIVNTTDPPRSFSDVWYVGDKFVGFENEDGEVQSGDDSALVVKIDTVGNNKPLIFESMNQDGVFESGEAWHFVLVDWTDTSGSGPVHTLCSVGILADSFADACRSSGSIIAIEAACTPSAEVCDGVDNDCDGMVDEGNPGGGAACSAGIGECSADGTIQCSSGALSCNAVVGSPTAEVCNGEDNDCDGVVDNGNPGGGGTCGSDVGVCEFGIEACQGGAIVCTGDIGPSTEICDGLDNDCNEDVDEGGVCEGPMTIDIKPGSDPSSVSCKNNKGSVPVAVFGSANFDVSTIDLGSLKLNEVPVTEKHDTIHIEDKNGDEFPDAVLHLEKAGVCEATVGYPLKESKDVTLTGSNGDGDFEGIGDIRIVKR